MEAFPKKFVTIQFETTFEVQSFPFNGEGEITWVLANGDTSGVCRRSSRPRCPLLMGILVVRHTWRFHEWLETCVSPSTAIKSTPDERASIADVLASALNDCRYMNATEEVPSKLPTIPTSERRPLTQKPKPQMKTIPATVQH